jgi:hypothetical protein
MASFVTGTDGKIMATSAPAVSKGFTQNISGSPIDAAASKTIASQAQQAQATKALGAGQKGSSRRRRRHKGGSQSIPKIPEGGTIPGVSFAGNHVKAIDTLNQLRADKVYDGLINAPAVKVGSSRKKRRTKSKKRHGGRHNRTHRRYSNKRSSHIRGARNVL